MMKVLFLMLSFSMVTLASEFDQKSVGTWEQSSAVYSDDESGDTRYSKTTLKIETDATCSVLIEEFYNDEAQFGHWEMCEIKGNFLWAFHESGRGGRQVIFKGYLNPTQDGSQLVIRYRSRAYNDGRTYIESFSRVSNF